MGSVIELVKALKPTAKKRTVDRDDGLISSNDIATRQLYWQFYQPPRDFKTLMSAYLKNPWVYAAVYLIASTASSVPFALYTRKTKRAVDADHYLWNVFTQPNPFMTFTDLLESTFLCLELVGNAFWEVVLNADGFVKSIYLLDPCNMRIVPDPIYYIRNYEYLVGDKKIVYNADEIVHFKYANPMNEYWGVGSLQPIWDQIILDTHATDYNARFFQNDATPGGIITSTKPISDNVFNQLINRWSQRHEGAKKAYKVAVLDDGMDFKSIATTPREASFPEMRKMVRDALFVGMGVPPVLAGVPDVANYSTARVAQSIFYDSTIAPKLRKVGDCIDLKIIKPQDASVKGAFDTSVAPINIIKLSANSRIIERLVRAKLVTVNEARALLGLPQISEEELRPRRSRTTEPEPSDNEDSGTQPSPSGTGGPSNGAGSTSGAPSGASSGGGSSSTGDSEVGGDSGN